MRRLNLLYNTVKYLKPVQIYYRVWYYIKNKLCWNRLRINKFKNHKTRSCRLNFQNSINSFTSYLQDNTFEFLNITHSFNEKVEWDLLKHGKLWAYNLNYFDFLLQKNMSKEDGLTLINDFIDTIDKRHVGIEPYPLSLRIINWIKFFSIHKIDSDKYDKYLLAQLWLLSKNIEYHLWGNHLLENGFALLFGAYFYNDLKLYEHAKNILAHELEEQILNDGAHFELSPMYHCQMTWRVLDCYNLTKNNQLFDKELSPLFKEKSEEMLSFLSNITFRNGNIPLLNDAAFNIAPAPDTLFEYATRLNLKKLNSLQLSGSGYKMLTSENFELFFDAAEVGPTYQPGHAHADTLSFELNINGKPVIVDTGTSTYEVNKTRFHERSTKAHNTVTINDENSSEVWAGHRVARRAKVAILKNEMTHVIASHNGYYKKYGIKHTRDVHVLDNLIVIKDDIQHESGVAHFHFAPDVALEIIGTQIQGEGFIISFENCELIEKIFSKYSPGFNIYKDNLKIQVSFKNYLVTQIVVQ